MSASTVSPLAPRDIRDPAVIRGVRLAVAEAGIKYSGRTDLMVAVLETGTSVAGVFTQSKCPSAPVEWCRDVLGGGEARLLVVNSGNANAFTGKRGREAVEITAKSGAVAAGCTESEVFLASTGVIGEPLAPEKFTAILDEVVRSAGQDSTLDAARAIMTTDTYPKTSETVADIGGVSVRVAGIAKGAGMIAPDMATMLAFVFTDAVISPAVLQRALDQSVRGSFNAITVDSDTSTSDTVLVFATGAASADGMDEISDPKDRRLSRFRKALDQVMSDLAKQVVRDGEGVRKFVTISVEGATTNRSAKRIAMSVANSPLVKTAVAGEDANWGRVVMAIGKAGEPADRDLLAIRFGHIVVAERGERVVGYDEDQASEYMTRDEIEIGIDLGIGRGKARVWTCDLTKDYVAINGDYRS